MIEFYDSLSLINVIILKSHKRSVNEELLNYIMVGSPQNLKKKIAYVTLCGFLSFNRYLVRVSV